MKLLAPGGLGALIATAVVSTVPVVAAPSASAAYPVVEARSCGAFSLDSRAASASTAPLAPALARSSITVKVYVHVLRTKKGGGVTNARVRRQVAILNRAYAGGQSKYAAASPFVFRLVRIDRTVNARWFRMDEGTVTEGHAKRALHRGNADDLNLYIGMNRSGSLGWGTQPGAYHRSPRMDGVVIRRTTMAGGTTGHYSSGDAAVHETGHWLGLLHTFAGRCGSRGDLVADTPREARPSYACPTRRNTCSAPGRDPVHNFMDYSYDSCMNQFTPGQVARMRQQWSLHRAGG